MSGAYEVLGYNGEGRNLRIPVTDHGPTPIYFGPHDRLSKTHHGAFRKYAHNEGHEHTGVTDIQVGKLHPLPHRQVGHLPRIEQPKYVTGVPKYLGFVPKKGACNQFSTRWQQGQEISYQRLGKAGASKLERAVSNPAILEKKKSMKTLQRVPGTMTNQPGVYSETVVGKPFYKANQRAQELREVNPYGTAKWMHRDPKYTLKWVRLAPGSDLKADAMPQYTAEENRYATLCAMEQELLPVSYTQPMSWVKHTGALSEGLSYNPGNIKKPHVMMRENETSLLTILPCVYSFFRSLSLLSLLSSLSLLHTPSDHESSWLQKPFWDRTTRSV
ncbi:unnamed protein product [Amoebophrya sp. A25]|nr:unnamed protein product [Amoebophrya sp. A25]|eukprot:GSA25T00027411001.1